MKKARREASFFEPPLVRGGGCGKAADGGVVISPSVIFCKKAPFAVPKIKDFDRGTANLFPYSATGSGKRFAPSSEGAKKNK